MALKVLMLRKRIDDKKKELEQARAKAEELKTREAELETAIAEAEADEEKAAVEEAIEAFDKEMEEQTETINQLDEEVRALESELHEMEEAQEAPAPEVPQEETRKENKPMKTRKAFFGMSRQEQAEMLAREDVQGFLTEVRTAMKEHRAITGVGALIPEVFLGLLKENIENYSKLYKHVRVRTVSGEARVAIMGEYAEAIWTDCCANLNEMSLAFYEESYDCWKVGGFYAICNATLEDSDIDLAAELIQALSQGIGLAVDKAILYGLGTRMPKGIMTRLVETEQPAGYPASARPWVDLHTTNIKSIAQGTTGAALFSELIIDAGAAKGKYSRGEKVWVMNENTYTTLIASATTIDASGAVVAGVNGYMPVIGGIIEVLSFIPDNVIIGGYFELYTLVERAGKKFATSEHVRFLQDQTVFKGTARYDGAPTIAEAFVAIGLNGVTPDATMPFAPDEANDDTLGA